MKWINRLVPKVTGYWDTRFNSHADSQPLLVLWEKKSSQRVVFYLTSRICFFWSKFETNYYVLLTLLLKLSMDWVLHFVLFAYYLSWLDHFSLPVQCLVFKTSFHGSSAFGFAGKYIAYFGIFFFRWTVSTPINLMKGTIRIIELRPLYAITDAERPDSRISVPSMVYSIMRIVSFLGTLKNWFENSSKFI